MWEGGVDDGAVDATLDDEEQGEGIEFDAVAGALGFGGDGEPLQDSDRGYFAGDEVFDSVGHGSVPVGVVDHGCSGTVVSCHKRSGSCWSSSIFLWAIWRSR